MSTPRYAWRGFMLDSARHFQSVETIEWILERMGRLGLNVFHWHLTDDAAWRLELPSFPELTAIGAARDPEEPDGPGTYSAADIARIVRFAEERGITVVPEIEMPSHATAALTCHPELTCDGKPIPIVGTALKRFTESTGRRTFCAGNPEVFTFLERVLDEVLDLFPSPVIHVGGDERPEGAWGRCPRCQSLGLANESEIQRAFMERINRHVRSRGRRTMAWTPTVQYGVPEGQIVHDWHFGVAERAKELGADVVLSLDRFTYFDYPNFESRQRPGWMPTLTADQIAAWDPGDVYGIECALWTEYIETPDIPGALFPRMAAFADVAWGRAPSDLGPWDVARPETADLAYPGRVECSMAPVPAFHPECAFDGRWVRSFWSAAPPRRGDHLTLHLDAPILLERVRVVTGSELAYDDFLPSGFLEVSEDGETFLPVGEVGGRSSEVAFAPRAVRAVRLVVAEDMAHRLAVTEVLLGWTQS